MKTISCDKCKKDKANQYKYLNDNGGWNKIDLCFNCVQEFVLEHKTRLIETNESIVESSNKKILYG